VKARKDGFDSYITYTSLKEIYEVHLIVATQLEVSQLRADLQERDRRMQCCARGFFISPWVYVVR